LNLCGITCFFGGLQLLAARSGIGIVNLRNGLMQASAFLRRHLLQKVRVGNDPFQQGRGGTQAFQQRKVGIVLRGQGGGCGGQKRSP